MASSVTPSLPLKIISDIAQEFRFSLTDAFFKEAEQEDVLGGNLEVTVSATRERDGATYRIALNVKGEVQVVCDRCLDELTLPVDTTDTVKLVLSEPKETDDDTIRFIGQRAQSYDLSDDIFQAVELSLPIQRVHEDGQCNSEMLDFLDAHSAHSSSSNSLDL